MTSSPWWQFSWPPCCPGGSGSPSTLLCGCHGTLYTASVRIRPSVVFCLWLVGTHCMSSFWSSTCKQFCFCGWLWCGNFWYCNHCRALGVLLWFLLSYVTILGLFLYWKLPPLMWCFWTWFLILILYMTLLITHLHSFSGKLNLMVIPCASSASCCPGECSWLWLCFHLVFVVRYYESIYVFLILAIILPITFSSMLMVLSFGTAENDASSLWFAVLSAWWESWHFPACFLGWDDYFPCCLRLNLLMLVCSAPELKLPYQMLMIPLLIPDWLQYPSQVWYSCWYMSQPARFSSSIASSLFHISHGTVPLSSSHCDSCLDTA